MSVVLLTEKKLVRKDPAKLLEHTNAVISEMCIQDFPAAPISRVIFG